MEIDFKSLSESPDQSMQDIIGKDIFGLLQSQNEAIAQEEEETPQHIVKFKYSPAKKQKMLEAFQTTYVNDYGKNDPYHIDKENSFVEKVKSQIHAIYGNRSIVKYILAMRDVFKVYKEMYEHSSSRLVMSLNEYIDRIVVGDIPAPFNHPLIRTNVPPEILMRYILDESSDPEEIKRYISTGNTVDDSVQYWFDMTDVEEQYNTPIEYQVLDEKIQTSVIKSWLSGKPKFGNLDKNESNFAYGLTSVYDKADLTDPPEFDFNKPISHHPDVISWKNIKRNTPNMVHLKDYTPEALKAKHAGQFIRDVMEIDESSVDYPGLTFRDIFRRIETNGAKRNEPVQTFNLANKVLLYAQGVKSVKVNKYGREVYTYRDKSKVKRNSVKSLIRDTEEKAKFFKELTDNFCARLHSPAFQNLVKEVQKEQDTIDRYGISYYTEGD